MTVDLRPFTGDDIALLLSWVGSSSAMRLWAGDAFRWPLDEAQLAAYLAETRTPGRRSWTTWDGRGQAVGHASLRVDFPARSGRLGRVLIAPQARRRGLAGEMLRQVLEVAFGDVGLRRLELGVYSDNVAAVRLYERMGFVADDQPGADECRQRVVHMTLDAQ
ncbi:GNAT family N-acetyltransferase [Streptomyces sp. NPDC005202]|uniref:GNAT family N-acetyltransferase n=1 Tax=Streptomyces sp. NPDC005202 TaxID=3157021 RepID=UPI0033A09183